MTTHGRRGHRRFRARTRWRGPSGNWEVRARVERFAEPALLLLLREGPRHGYELLEQLPQLVAEPRVDVGNLYRFLRALEDDGIVRSEWNAELPGPARRTYELTDEGRRLLDAWADALRQNQDVVGSLLSRYEQEGR